MSRTVAPHMKASMGRLRAALFIWRRARCHGASRHGGKAPVDSLLFTTKPAIDALILVLVLRSAAEGRASRRTGRGRESGTSGPWFETRASRAPHHGDLCTVACFSML